MIRIAAAQINLTVGDLTGNADKIIRTLQQARDAQCDIVVFPEMAVCGYPPEDLLHKRYFIRDNLKALRSVVPHTRGLLAVIGFVDIGKTGALYNAAALVHNGTVRKIYHKRELPNYGVFDEKRYFVPGKALGKITLKGVTCGVSICEDMWVDQGVCAQQAKAGCRLLLNLSSSPFDVGKQEERKAVARTKARQHKAYLCYANLVGGQDELVFDGSSLLVDPKGRLLAQGKAFEEELLIQDLPVGTKPGPDKPLVNWSGQRAGKKPFDAAGEAPAGGKPSDAISLSTSERPATVHNPVGQPPYTDMSALTVPDAAEARASVRNACAEQALPGGVKPRQLQNIYKALVLGTRDYIQKNGFQKVVIGLSGGIDSALVAAVAVDAIGPAQVVGVSMPSQYSSRGTQTDAKRLARQLGIELKEIPIQSLFTAYAESLAGEFAGTRPDAAEENIQARIRGNLLMALSNKFGWLVLTTGNKSELAVGYCTLYGDMSGGFAVLKDVPKTLVYALAEWRNAVGPRVRIPASILKRAPTAELRANQKDQDSLPPYAVLDEYLKDYVENHNSLKALSKGANKALVKKVIKLVDNSEYKRRQAPPGIKITRRAFGRDWRLPITNKYKEF
jgi:NAD+ synthase (glutamine-hydrolysing)